MQGRGNASNRLGAYILDKPAHIGGMKMRDKP